MSASPQYEHVVEIGAGDLRTAQAVPYIGTAKRVTFYEPNPLLWQPLSRDLRVQPTVTVVGAAVAAKAGHHPLVLLGYASYLKGYPSFFRTGIEENNEAHLNPEQHFNELTLTVPVLDVASIDDGSWDVLILTCNGAEPEVLAGMRSCPRKVLTKHYIHNGTQSAEAHKIWAALSGMGYTARAIEVNEHRTFAALEWSKRGGVAS